MKEKNTHTLTHTEYPTKTATAAITKTSNKNTSNAAKESQGFGKFSKDSIRKHFGKVKAEIQLKWKWRNNNGRKCKTKPWNMFHYFVDLSHRPKETNPQISECNDLHLYIAHRERRAAHNNSYAMPCQIAGKHMHIARAIQIHT